MTRDGINKSILDETFKTKTSDSKKIGVIYLDDTSIIEWYYVFKSYFYKNRILPQKLILNFASDQLRTQELEFEELYRISSYVPFNQLYEICKQESLNYSQIIDIYLAKSFRIFSHRERISKRILDIIPNYRSAIRKLNSYNHPDEQYLGNSFDYKHLKKIIDMIEMVELEMIFCAMPLYANYTIDNKIVSIIENSNNCKIIGFNNDSSFTNHHFKDGYHLNSVGARKFTKSFAEMIAN